MTVLSFPSFPAIDIPPPSPGEHMLMDGTEIRTLRHGLWTHVASRRHYPTKVFFGADDEVMLYGTVRYVLRADSEGKEVEVPWAGRVVFSLDEGVKMRFYQVYLVCLLLLLLLSGGLGVGADFIRTPRRSPGRNKR